MKPHEDEPELLEKKEGLVSRSLLIVLASLAALGVVIYTILSSVPDVVVLRSAAARKSAGPSGTRAS